jgi:hypothetical protein
MATSNIVHCHQLRLASYVIVVGFSFALSTDGAFAQDDTPPSKSGSVAKQLAESANQVERLVKNDWVKEWLKHGANLPSVDPFTVEINGRITSVDEELFYVGRFGSPLAYARALDLAGDAGLDGLDRKRVFDFGYGSIASVRMMAAAGAEITGVDVSPLVQAMYADHSGSFGQGKIQLLHGRFPKDDSLVDHAGTNYDLIISKNTLKKGYIHPSRSADPRMLVDLGVDDETFLKGFHDLLKAKGLVIIYNICPAKAAADQDYVPWAEGENPFSKEQWQSAGFEVLHYDVEDHTAARELGHVLGWDQGANTMDLEQDLFAWYSIMRRIN